MRPTQGPTTRCSRSRPRPWDRRSSSPSSSTATPTPTSPPMSSARRWPTSSPAPETSTGSSPTSRPRSRRTPSSEILGIVAVPIDASELTAKADAGRRRRRYSTLTGTDRVWLWAMVAVPTLLHVMLVWVPALLTVSLSFTEWDNLAPLTDIRAVGFQNYWYIFTVFDGDLFPALFNNFALVIWLTICSMVGMLFAYLLDKNVRGSRFYQSVYYFPVVLSLAVVGFIWKSTMFSRDRGLLNSVWPGGRVDFVGDGSKLFQFDLPWLDTSLGLSRNFTALLIAMAWRHIGYIMVIYL